MIGCCLSAGAQTFGWALKPEYESIANYSEGIAAVMKNGKWGYVSDRGVEILAPTYDVAYPFSEGLGVLTSSDRSLIALVDKTGKLIPVHDKLQIDSRFAAFSEGLLLVSKGKKWGYIGKDGKQAIECKYDAAQPFSEGLAAAVFDSRQCYCWYYMDESGKAVFHLSDLKKDIYWALGFYKGKALVLHSKGAFFIDKSGQELKENLPSITPPEEAAGYTKATLTCKEGTLAFDAKCRAVSFSATNGRKTEFIPTSTTPAVKSEYTVRINGTVLAAENIQWMTPSMAVVKAGNSKYGIITVYDSPLLSFSLPYDTLTSVFGNPSQTNLSVRNISTVALEKVDIQVNGETYQAASMAPGSTVLCPLSFDKTTENETETKALSITAWNDGLQIGDAKRTLWIQDIPSLSINVPANKVAIQLNQSAYSVSVQVKNRSAVAAGTITVTVDRQTQTLYNLAGGETGTVQFTFPSPKESGTRTLYISAKVQNTPPVTASARITLDVPLPPPPTF